jgi:hypothetical protein
MMSDHPDDGGSTDLWNAVELIPVYTALQPRGQPSLYSLSWEPQIIHTKPFSWPITALTTPFRIYYCGTAGSKSLINWHAYHISSCKRKKPCLKKKGKKSSSSHNNTWSQKNVTITHYYMRIFHINAYFRIQIFLTDLLFITQWFSTI